MAVVPAPAVTIDDPDARINRAMSVDGRRPVVVVVRVLGVPASVRQGGGRCERAIDRVFGEIRTRPDSVRYRSDARCRGPGKAATKISHGVDGERGMSR